ncbi:signal peptidase II [Nocardiopsis kunsanensis]|uniref:signal peptidase II n=1 Tax=Nocardiopsis kunsanensis TaxID=141693 RepID=UPI00034D6335|nr:signal peptidase II [Nocardiopsis kunsanensis]
MTTTEEAAGRPRRYLLLMGVALGAIVVDFLTKEWALAALTHGEFVDVIGEFLQFTLVFNTGAAFSLGTGYTWVFTVISTIVVLAIGYMGRRVRNPWWGVTLGLMMGGAAGNLVDRFFRPPGPFEGAVVDFLSVPNWPVFNIADSCVVVGAVLVVVLTFKGINLDGTLASDESRDTTATARPEQADDRNDDTGEQAGTDAERGESGNEPGEGRGQ